MVRFYLVCLPYWILVDYIFVGLNLTWLPANNLRRISTMYVQGYLQGSENGRVVTIGDHRTQFWKGPSMDHSTKVWLQLANWFLRRRFLCEFPIGSYVKLSSAVGAHLGRRAVPLDIFLEENHPMSISSTFSSNWANGFRQEDFYVNFP